MFVNKLHELCQIGLEFLEFLEESRRTSITDRFQLKVIYDDEFRIRTEGIKDPRFGSVLYGLKVFHKITRVQDDIRFTSTVKTLLPEPSHNAAALPEIISEDKAVTGVRPRRRLARLLMKEDRAQLISDKNGIRITSDHQFKGGELFYLVDKWKQRVVKLKVENTGTETVYFTYYTPLHKIMYVTLTDEHKVTKANPLCLKPGDSYEIQVCFSCSYLFTLQLAFEFKPDQRTSAAFHIMRFINYSTDFTVVDGQPPERLSVMQPPSVVALTQYQMSKNMDRLIKSLKESTTVLKDDRRLNVLKSPLSWKNYFKKFQLLLYLEEKKMELEIKKYNITSDSTERKYATMTRDPVNKKLLILEVPGLSEGRPSVLYGDELIVYPIGDEKVKYRGYVHAVQLDSVKLGFGSELLGRFMDNMKFIVEFTFSRLTLRLQHRALQLADKHRLEKVLFPSASALSHHRTELPELKLFDSGLEKNPQQYQAVQHIVAGSSKPAPYVVFGPPGTGKTVTLVEAIKQLEKSQTSCNILACTSCNSAADQLCQEIIKTVDKRKVYRMYASSMDPKCVPEQLKACSNLQGNYYVFPSKEQLMEYRIMVTTLFTAGRLVTVGVPEGHFTHVFVDEAGHALETECLIPMAGLLHAKSGQLVLAGDPKQLGPIVKCSFALKYGMGVSLLERMMNYFHLYKKNGAYNSCFITKLLHNYRSHPAILKVPKDLFYESELEACAEEKSRNSFCNWKHLPKKGFPLIFHDVNGVDKREATSPSFFNIEEVEMLTNYVRKLLQMHSKKELPTISPGDIGIITPYRAQVKKIRMALDRIGKALKVEDMNNLMVGSVEEFQGQERRVIMVSTVRSIPDYTDTDIKFNLGFVKNEKRFNVAVTRAKALLIVVGNSRVLSTDTTWCRFIEYCKNEGGYKDEAERDENVI